MKNRFVISENDRRSILSMYGLLNEENATRIVGKVRTTPFYDLASERSKANNLTLKIYGNNVDDSYETLDGSDIEDMQLLGQTVTNVSGQYVFDDITDFNDLIISFEGNDFFEPLNHRVEKITPNKDNVVDFSVKFKEEEKKEIEKKQKEKPKKIRKCEIKNSIGNKIYGYGEYSIDGKSEEIIYGKPFKENTQVKMFEEASKAALKDAIANYISLYPNELVTVDVLYKNILGLIGTPELKKLKITCKRVYFENGKIVATTVVKFKKDFFDEITKKLEPKPVERKIDFDDIDFKKALENSFDQKKKIFLFFCVDNNECNVLLDNFVKLGNLDKKLNGWIKLYYKVDMSQDKKYVAASETLKIFAYPSVVILEAIKDPKINPIKDSIKIIKKITSFDQTESEFENLLN